MEDKEYYQQFEVADLTRARQLLFYCMSHGIKIDLDKYSDDFITDLLIVKCMELAKFEKKDLK